MGEFSISTSKREELVDITDEVSGLVKESGVKEGVCYVYCPHTTGAITINENADPSVKTDIIRKLRELIPENDNYEHSEGNSDAHLKSSLVGNCAAVFIENGGLKLGTWQGIMFCEFDGPRERKVLVKIIGG